MAISTYGVYLMIKEASTWEKLVDIKDFPDLQGEPQMIDTTTLSDPAVTQILGIRQAAAKAFRSNYDAAIYAEIKALEGAEQDVAVWFGHDATGKPNGHNGKFEGKGIPSVLVNGAGVNAPTEMTTTFAMTKEFTIAE